MEKCSWGSQTQQLWSGGHNPGLICCQVCTDPLPTAKGGGGGRAGSTTKQTLVGGSGGPSSAGHTSPAAGPPTWERHTWGTCRGGTAEGLSWSIKGSTNGKPSPDPAPEHCTWCKMGSTDPQSCKGQCQNLQGRYLGIASWPKGLLIHGILYFSAGNPHYQEDQMERSNKASFGPMERWYVSAQSVSVIFPFIPLSHTSFCSFFFFFVSFAVK